MDLLVDPSRGLHGTVVAPPNKSHSFRALILAGLADGVSEIASPALSGDWYRGVAALRKFGCDVEQRGDNLWLVTGRAGRLSTPDDVIDCGNSGIIFRFFAALAGCCDGYTVLSGDESIRHIRPCGPLLEAMNQLGAWAVSTKGDGHAPVVVRGPLRGGKATIDGADSQPVSALLIAASMIDSPTELTVTNPGERPWVDMTLAWLQRGGVHIDCENHERYHIPGRGRLGPQKVRIPGDWSAAMYPIVAALVCPDSQVRVEGIRWDDVQGDRLLLNVLRDMGAELEIGEDTVVARSSRLVGRTIDCNDFIDQFMLLAVIGALAEGETVLTNAGICRQKECDRITEMHHALSAMGAATEERPDGMVIQGGRLKAASLDSRSDHRMVMTLTVAALAAAGQSRISDVECVAKTFPDFPDQMAALGCKLRHATE